jgi:sialic acid synthase SpsE
MVRRATFPHESPYLVAAVDYNHNGSVALGRRLIEIAADAGADAVKVVLRRVVDTVAPEVLDAPWLGGDSLGRTHREVWTRLQLRPSALGVLRRSARRYRLAFVAAPYDLEMLKLARHLRPDVYQIDAPVLGDPELLRGVKRARRPVLLVAGMCTEADIARALRLLGRVPVVVVHTVAAAQIAPSGARLGYVPWLKRRFKRPVGYLGAEPGVAWSLIAATLGASVIEKPLTIDHALDGPFHASSLNPTQFRALATGLSDLRSALAQPNGRVVLPEELDTLASDGHSLVARRRLTRGTRLQAKHLAVQAPMRGLSPRLRPWVEGRRLAYDVEAGEPITFGLLE